VTATGAGFADRVRDTLAHGRVSPAEESFGDLTVEVGPADWRRSVQQCRDELGLVYFDWLSAVDELDGRFRVVLHLVDPGTMHRLLLTTVVTEDASGAQLASITDLYAGASWHERETWEMFGVAFDGHPHLAPLLLPDGFDGRPLRKDFVLAARVAKPWPGAKEPGESAQGSPSRRKTLPPGVPDPSSWGPGATRQVDRPAVAPGEQEAPTDA
jgi:NADH:ubiquinone oxidoreductase subunit C